MYSAHKGDKYQGSVFYRTVEKEVNNTSESHHVSEGVKKCHICKRFISAMSNFRHILLQNHLIVWYCESFCHIFSYLNALADFSPIFWSSAENTRKSVWCPIMQTLNYGIITDQGTAGSEQEGTVKPQISGTCVFKAQTPMREATLAVWSHYIETLIWAVISGCKCLEVPLLLQRQPTPHLADV